MPSSCTRTVLALWSRCDAQHPVNAARESSAMHDDVTWSTMSNATGSDNQPFTARPPPPLSSFPSTTYDALAAGVPCYRDQDARPIYKSDLDSERRVAAYDDFRPAAMTSQLLPLQPVYATHHLHPSISAYQQQQQQQQASSYIKTEITASEQSNAQGWSEWATKFDNLFNQLLDNRLRMNYGLLILSPILNRSLLNLRYQSLCLHRLLNLFSVLLLVSFR